MAESQQAGYVAGKRAVMQRLDRIEGQVRGIKSMVENEAYCIDVLTQIGAASKALDQVSLKLLGDHTAHCLRGVSGRDGGDTDEKTAELLAAVERFARVR